MATKSTTGTKGKRPQTGQKPRGGRKKGSPVKPHNDMTAAKRESFLSLLYDGFSVSKAAKVVSLARSFVYDLRDRDEEFAKAWKKNQLLGHKHRCDLIEDAIWKRAMDGYEEETKRNGKVVKSVTKVDNNLLARLAEAEMPDKYGRVKVDATIGLDDDLKAMIEKAQQSDSSRLDSLVKE